LAGIELLKRQVRARVKLGVGVGALVPRSTYPLFTPPPPHQAAGTSHDLNDKFMTSAKFELTYGEG
jgi:hypothetical protein